MHPAVFLDLDNTIIRGEGESIAPEGLALVQGAAPAIASLRGLGYRVVVAVNHPGVARGRWTEDDIAAHHARVAELVEQTANGAFIDAFYYCPYDPAGNLKQYKKDHANRKPKPGMLLQAAEEMKLELSASWTIGDLLIDIQAGHAAGTRTILLRPDADRLRPMDPTQLAGLLSEAPDKDRPAAPDFYAVGLIDAVRIIAQQPRAEAVEAKRTDAGRKWDARKIAEIQVARATPAAERAEPAARPGKAFRPWGAPAAEEDEDKPLVAKPFRKRFHREHDEPGAPADAVAVTAEPAPTTPAQPRAATPQPVPQKDIPDNIRKAIEHKRQTRADGGEPQPGVEKTLRLILQELRNQRGAPQEFSYLTIVALALQLVAVVCVLGALFMGGPDDGVFLRWLGVGLIAQMTSIATLMYGR